jgi:DnaJ-like protein/HEAT repeat protein
MVENSYYQLLKVRRNATVTEIKAAYRRSVVKYHPDLNRHPGAARHFQQIVRAYESIIKDKKEKDSRKVSDQERNGLLTGSDQEQQTSRFIERLLNRVFKKPGRKLFSRNKKIDRKTLEMPVRELKARLTGTDNPYMQKYALKALALHSDPAAARILVDAVLYLSEELRPLIFDSMADRTDRMTVRELTRLARNTDPQIRVDAVNALGRIGNRYAREALKELLTESPLVIRGRIRHLLEHMGG